LSEPVTSAVPPTRATRQRIAVIGAGSAYMPGVIRGLRARAADLRDSELVFYDINTEHVELMAKLASRMFEAVGARFEVTVAATLDAAVEAVDFVFTSFRPGGMPARHLDETIPLRYGVLGQETIGPGGFLMACRSVPALLRIAESTMRLAPQAWIINYTNPTNIVTDAVLRFGGSSRIVGLCDQYLSDQQRWARLLGLDPHGFEADWYGTNHGTWARTARMGGVDVSADVQARLVGLNPDDFDDVDDRRLAQLGRDFGYLVNSYSRYYYFHDEIVASLSAPTDGPPRTTRGAWIQARLPKLYENFAVEADKSDPDPSGERGGSEHGEFAVDTICAVAGDEGRRLIANTRNDGTVADLDDDAVVEVPVRVDAAGFHPYSMGSLPHPARGLTQAVHEYERLAAEAAALGSTRKALQALMAHPLVRSRAAAEGILTDGLREHRDHLAQFARGGSEH